MIFEMMEGYSEGLMGGFTREELNEHFAKEGVTIVYIDNGRHVYLDDTILPVYAEEMLTTMEHEQVEVDWFRCYDKGIVVGYGAMHPYLDLEKWIEERRKKRKKK